MNLLILAFSLYILVAVFFLFYWASGSISLRSLNTITIVFYKDFLPVAFIGSLLVVLNLVDNHPMISLISNENKIKGWLFILYSLIMMPLSIIIFSKLMNLNITIDYKKYLKSEIKFEADLGLIKRFSILLTAFSTLTLFYILYNSPSIPLLDLIRGNIEEAAIGRGEVKRNFRGIIYIKNIFGLYLMPLITFYIYIYHKKTKSMIFKLLFLLNLCLTVILFTYDTQKAQILFFLVGFLIVDNIISDKIKWRKVLIFGVLIILLVIYSYIFVTGEESKNLLKIDSVITYRIFVTSIGGYFLSLEWFPYLINNEKLYLVGIPSFILQIFGIEVTESARLLMEIYNPIGVSQGSAGLLSSYYLGEAWANYGYVGLIFSPIIVGLVIGSMHIWLIKNIKSPINVAFYATVSTKWVVTGGFVNFLYLKIIIISFLVYFIFKLLLNTFLGRQIKISN